MSSVFTLFARLYGALSAGEATDPDTSDVFSTVPGVARHNVVYYRQNTVQLAAGETETIAFPYNPNGWVLFLGRVEGTSILPTSPEFVGEAKLDVAGTAFDGTTPITGEIPGYGTTVYPGMIGMTVKGGTTFTLRGVTDSSKVSYLMAVIVEDDQLP